MTGIKKTISTAAIAVVAIAFVVTHSPSSYPTRTLPPTGWGRTNPDITQSNIDQTICNQKWSTKSIRPTSSYTTSLKMEQLKAMGYPIPSFPSQFEEDHIISLELGGAPSDPNNLWPEPYQNPVAFNTNPPTQGNLGAKEKDSVENYLHKQVCNRNITLEQAQKEISTDWVKIYESVKGIDLVDPSTSDD